MNFNSYIFVLLFVPLVVLGYFFFNRRKQYRAAQVYLLLMSLVFYVYAGIPYFLLLLASVAGNFLFSILIEKTGKKKLWMIAGVIFNLLILFYFKYYDFFVSNLNAVFHKDFVLKHIALPLGISFYTFQQLSFIVDRGTGRSPHHSLLDYMCYVTFFPQLVAGPIVKHDELIPQFRAVCGYRDRYGARGLYAGMGRPGAQDEVQGEEIVAQNVDLIRGLIEAHPETEFYIVIPAESILYWDREYQSRGMERALSSLEYAVKELSVYDNVVISGGLFNDFETVMNLDNYMDLTHASYEKNCEWAQMLVNKEHLLNADNIGEELDILRRMVEDFEERCETDTYPDFLYEYTTE